MATLSFNGQSYTVDHAVKGADYVHGYDANGVCIIALDGIVDFSSVTYNGTYMTPDACFEESCNDVKFIGGRLQTENDPDVLPKGVKTIDDVVLRFAVLLEEAYDALSERQKEDLLAIITDDDTLETLISTVSALDITLQGVMSGKKTVAKANKAYSDEYGASFKDKYLNITDLNGRGYRTGTMATGVSVYASEEYGTYYNVRVIWSDLQHYDFGIIYIDGNEQEARIAGPMITVTDGNTSICKLMLAITNDGGTDGHGVFKVELWEFDLNGNRVTNQNRSDVRIEMRALNGKFIIGE